MVNTSSHSGSKGSTRKISAVITNARSGTSREMASREKRYAVTMAIRTACFVSMIFVSGPLRWVFLAGAVFLPYLAVVLANQADTRNKDVVVERGEPVDAPQINAHAPGELGDGELVAEPGDIEGDVIDSSGLDVEDDRWAERDRVA